MNRKKEVKTKLLLGGGELEQEEGEEEEEAEENPNASPILSYWYPNISLQLIKPVVMSYAESPDQIKRAIVLEPTGLRDKTGKNGWFCKKSLDFSFHSHYSCLFCYTDPIIFNNQFWHLQSQMSEINSTVKYDHLPIMTVYIL